MQYRIERTGTHNTDGHAFLVVSFWHDGNAPPAPPDLVNDFLIGVHTLPSQPKHVVDSKGRRLTRSGKWTMGWQLKNGAWEGHEDPTDPWQTFDNTHIQGYVQDIIEEWYEAQGINHSGSIVDPRLPALCGAARGMHAPIKALEAKVHHGRSRN